MRQAQPAVQGRGATVALAAVWLGYSWFASGFAPQTGQAAVLVLIPSVVAVLLVARRGRPTGPEWSPTLRRTVAAWAAVLVAVCLWELRMWLHQPDLVTASYDYPTLSALADPVLEHRGPRFLAWLAWLGLGWKLVRR